MLIPSALRKVKNSKFIKCWIQLPAVAVSGFLPGGGEFFRDIYRGWRKNCALSPPPQRFLLPFVHNITNLNLLILAILDTFRAFLPRIYIISLLFFGNAQGVARWASPPPWNRLWLPGRTLPAQSAQLALVGLGQRVSTYNVFICSSHIFPKFLNHSLKDKCNSMLYIPLSLLTTCQSIIF